MTTFRAAATAPPCTAAAATFLPRAGRRPSEARRPAHPNHAITASVLGGIATPPDASGIWASGGEKTRFTSGMRSSDRSDWETPPELYAALDREFGFVLDVCATETNHKAAEWYSPADSAPFPSAIVIFQAKKSPGSNQG